MTLSSATTWGDTARTASRASDRGACLHCGLPAEPGATFCCDGCHAVYDLLREEGLTRYYDLGGGAGNPVSSDRATDRLWLDAVKKQLAGASGLGRVAIDVQGIHCAACVWLVERVFERTGSKGRVLVNPALGRCDLTVPSTFDLDAFVDQIERFGYRVGPRGASDARGERSPLLWRLGVCVAIAMNTMIFGFAFYTGLSDGPLYRSFQALNFGLSFVSVVVGGPVFFRPAIEALRRRVLHLDVPIALGIALAFAASALAFALRRTESTYFDTVNVFIALMLAGRYAQERVLAQNRRYVLSNGGAESLLVRVVRGDRAEIVSCGEIEPGQTLLVASGDLVPVDATLDDDGASFSLDWINGEAAPRRFLRGESIPAGAFSREGRAVRLVATARLEGSRLSALLSAAPRDAAGPSAFWRFFSNVYVVAVLVIAAVGFSGWLLATGDAGRALDVTAALLIVTCPCAIGIAAPVAHELALTRLRRAGLFVRTPELLDRLDGVRRVVFDKTGTLTTGRARVEQTAGDALTGEARDVAYSLACSTAHPKADALRRALEGARLVSIDATEIAGRGVEAIVCGARYRLGAPGWAAEAADADLVLGRDGAVLAAYETRETLRSDAAREIDALAARGYAVSILSGDDPARVSEIAAACGVPEARAVGGKSPEEKQAFVAANAPEETLFIGDGINDSLAATEARVSGTPAIDRPFLASRCDFYFITPGIAPIAAAFDVAARLRRVVRRNLGIALAYNVVTVVVALAGGMSPLVAAIVMPISSITTLLATVTTMRAPTEASPWRS